MTHSSLLQQVSALQRTQEKMTLLSGENFNVFRILGLEANEVRMHSAFLGELLNPAGSHGLRDAFLKLFVEAIGFTSFPTATARVVVEYDIGRVTADYSQGGRIDIYLESAGQYLFIENKIYAHDQQNQLERYRAHRKDARLLYLTLEGAEPTNWGAGKLLPEQYQRLSYRTDIVAWLDTCRQVAVAYPLVRETIVQYQHLIHYLTGKAPNDFIRMEMQQLVQQSEENFVSAHALKQAFEESQAIFVRELIHQFEEKWYARFSENVSPFPDYAIYFRLHNNSYGFRAVRDGKDVLATEEALRPLAVLIQNKVPKLKRDRNHYWLAWKWMSNRYFNNIPPAELYQAVKNEEARLHLFEDRLREGQGYFDQVKELMREVAQANKTV
ncbi:PD-(D/E)XK nuclease family protein [Hymenobacter sp. BT507]|uniref:PD-(D/E)XK nuclease family protein n=1 Tax=Hymenobacter citatus TaxID=2763506 RepID=A0ABR7MMX4_9BACT|nr:PD-(D/E)XK nuclease family protein [Hymenobacter citatus]MBC6612421.1 PD-(D/E)XK nuclease family protein [Hymenobacter citatus]